MRVQCLVPCRDAEGVPTLFACVVTCTPEQYDSGDHYDKAAEIAEENRYEVPVGQYGSRLVIDENDGPPALFCLYDRDFQEFERDQQRRKKEAGGR